MGANDRLQNERLRNGLKQTRLRLGFSQQDVAAMAGVSRQTISSVESGQTVLSVAAALRLAKKLGCSVEDLFWLDGDAPVVEAWPDDAMPAGKPVRVSLTRVADRWIARSLLRDDAFRTDFVPADGETVRQPGRETVSVKLLDDPQRLSNGVAIAGCSPALSLWARAAERWHPDLRVQLAFANSHAALERLLRGEVHLAGMHRYCPKERAFNEPFVRQRLQEFLQANSPAIGSDRPPETDRRRVRKAVLIALGVWEEGLLVAPGNPKGIRAIADLTRADVAMVNREPGAGSREVLEQALAEAGISPDSVAGFDRQARSHQAIAQAVLAGEADAGVSAAAIAETFGLDFIPLRESRYDLVALESTLAEPPVQQLLNALGHRRTLAQLETFGGYDTRRTGDIVATVEPAPLGTDPDPNPVADPPAATRRSPRS